MSMRLVEGEFPDYHQVIPAKSERIASIDAANLLAALRRGLGGVERSARAA